MAASLASSRRLKQPRRRGNSPVAPCACAAFAAIAHDPEGPDGEACRMRNRNAGHGPAHRRAARRRCCRRARAERGQFYKGRQISMVVFSGAGSTYDIYARLLARHLGEHIPGNPTFVVQNMLGAGGLKVEEYLFRLARKDGSGRGSIGRGPPSEPMRRHTEVKGARLKGTCLGSMNRSVSLAMSWRT